MVEVIEVLVRRLDGFNADCCLPIAARHSINRQKITYIDWQLHCAWQSETELQNDLSGDDGLCLSSLRKDANMLS